MKQLKVCRLPHADVKAIQVPIIMDAAGIEFVPIDSVNWPASYPYHPRTEFRIAHNGHSIMLHYRVEEATVRAMAEADGGRVWEDSCCEFFFAPACDGIYYNLESNCAATILLASGTGRADREKASAASTLAIDRWTSLGRHIFDARNAPHVWQMALVVPKEAFFKHNIASLTGMECRANFYKCGDLLPVPHFLSWNPIATEAPDFHRPEYFGKLVFE